jgi:xylitol oxidase
LFTDWKDDNFGQVWVKSRLDENARRELPLKQLYGAKPAVKNLHPIIDIPHENCTEQMGVSGPWFARLPHFKMEFMPSSGVELQSEYFVPLEHAHAAIAEIFKLQPALAPCLQISEIRTVAADNFWMSPCYQRASVAIHFTWEMDWPAVEQRVQWVEQALSRFSPRTHWGKMFTLSPAEVQAQYKRLDDFRHLASEFDPSGKFRNDYLDKFVFSR